MAEGQTAAPEIKVGQDLLPVVRQLEDSADDAHSPRGAVGRYQIMPGTARSYGFDPAKLSDPAYNEQVAATVLNDLWHRYRGNTTDVLAAYNAGSPTTNRWIAGGRKDTLPQETANYLQRASALVNVGGAPLHAPESGDGAATVPQQANAQTPAGRAAMQTRLDAGFSNDEVMAWKDQKTKDALAAGFKPDEIDAYWGDTAPPTGQIDTHVSQNLSKIGQANVPKVAQSPLDMVAAGWDMSVSGLQINQRLPPTVLGPDAGIGAKTLSAAGQVAGDFPEMVMGAVMGAGIGEKFGGRAGATIGGLFGAGALPQAMRETMIDSYRRGEIHSSSDFLKMAGGSLFRTGKAGLVMATAGPVGSKVSGVVAPAMESVAGPMVSNVVSTSTNVLAQAATMTTLDAGFAGKLPDAGDFTSAAVLMLGMHAAGSVIGARENPRVELNEAGASLKGNLEELYKQTGIPPWLAVKAAREDPALMDELMARDVHNEPVFTKFRQLMNEPDSFQGAPPTTHNAGISVDPNWMLEGPWVGEAVVRKFPSGAVVPDPEAVASYMKKFGELAGFKFQVGPPELQQPNAQTIKTTPGPGFQTMKMGRNGRVAPERMVYIPDTPDELTRRWYGLGAAEVVYHEVGHAIDQAPIGDKLNVREADIRGRGWSPELADEIKQASQMFAPKLWEINPGYRAKNASEQMADAIALWLSNPAARKLMPNFQKVFGAQLDPYVEAADSALPQRTSEGWQRARAEQAEMGAGGNGGQPPGSPPSVPGAAQPPPPRAPRIDLDPTMRLDERMLNEIANEFIGEPKRTDEMLDPAYHYRQWISELGQALAIDKMLAEQGFDRKQEVGLEDMFRQTYGSDGRTGYFIFKGGLDPVTLKGTKAPPITDAVKAVKEDGGNLNDWINYMVAKRAISKAAQGKETGHPLAVDQLEKLVALGEPKYARATESMQRTLDSALEYGRDSGVFSQEQIDAMRRDNPIYISFRRLMGDEETVPGPKGGRRGFKVREPVARFEGDDRRIQNPLIATIDNINQIVRMADRNRAVGSAIALAEQHGLTSGLGLKQLSAREVPAPYATIAEPGSSTFKPYDVETTAPYEPFLAIKASRFGGFRNNQFAFFRDGKLEVWEATDPVLAKLMRGADTPGEANVALRVAQGVAALQRTGIVTAVDFPVRNTFRDQVQAYIADPLSPPPFITWMRGAFQVFTKSDRYWNWVGNGGAGMAMVEMDRNVIQRDMQHLFEETGTWNSMWNVVRHPLEASQILSAKIDEASRVGYMMHGEGEGLTALKAATMSRKALLDFVERGTSTFVQGWARVTPFMRPNILALKQAGEAIAGDPMNTLLKGLTAVTLPSVVLYALNYWQDQYLPESRQYKNLPRYWKDGMYILPEVGGVRLRLPLPGPFGTAFGAVPVRFLDYFLQNDEAAFRDWSSAFLAQIIPPFIPSVVLPAVEHFANTSWFSQHKLVPASMEKNSGPMQYTENTTETAKALALTLGKVGVDASPIFMENYVREWTGSLGMAALKALSLPFTTSEKPWTVEDLPFVQSFLIRNPGMSAQPVRDFFTELGELQTAAADKRLALKRAGIGVDNEAELDQAMPKYMDTRGPEQTRDAVVMQSNIIQGINNDKTMTREEKLHATDEAYSNMITTAKFGLEVVRSMRAAQKAQ